MSAGSTSAAPATMPGSKTAAAASTQPGGGLAALSVWGKLRTRPGFRCCRSGNSGEPTVQPPFDSALVPEAQRLRVSNHAEDGDRGQQQSTADPEEYSRSLRSGDAQQELGISRSQQQGGSQNQACPKPASSPVRFFAQRPLA